MVKKKQRRGKKKDRVNAYEIKGEVLFIVSHAFNWNNVNANWACFC